jgi:hypothetical protein
MNSTRLMRAAILATTLSTALVACGGGGGSDNDPDAFKAPITGGIWHGTDPLTGDSLYGIVNEGGAFVFLTTSDVTYSGSATFTKGSVNGTFQGFAPTSLPFDNVGSTHGTGSISGVLDQQKTLDLAVTFLGDASTGPADNGVLNLTYDKLYDRDSSLFTISGNFGTNGATVLSIAASGAVFAQGANDCVINGQVTVDNAQHNTYSISIKYANCTGSDVGLNGVELAGLFTLDNTKSPEQLIGAFTTATGATAPFAIPLILDRL